MDVPRRWRLAERAALAADALVGLPAPYPAPYIEVWAGLIRARALIAAVRLGVFDALPGTTEQLATRCGADPARLGVLLEALRTLRYVKPGWRATRRARRYFGPGATVRLDATVGQLSAAGWEVLGGLEDVLRGGEPPGLHGGVADPSIFAGYQAAMVELGALSEAVTLGALGHPSRLLDIGGGPGTLAMAACGRWPDLQATVADFEDAAQLGRARVAQAGLADRIRYVAGDAGSADLGGPYDVVTMVSLLHNVHRAAGVDLLRAARRAVASDGRVVVGEIDGTGTQVGALASLTFCAWMGARARTRGDLEAMAREAGFSRVRATRPARLGGSGLLVVARP